ncbi:hypothetical protein C7S13_2779 [Burkholderia cepacia]|nr:hypothetical protein [Burkholderia cepacia]
MTANVIVTTPISVGTISSNRLSMYASIVVPRQAAGAGFAAGCFTYQ